MLELLHIENIALIEKVEVGFGPGLNVLTGETGAGKSIIIDALSAATGARTSRDIVRKGADNAVVTAVVSNFDNDEWLSENGVEPDDDGRLFLMRKITADGKNTCRVNGAPVSVSQLRELGALIIDIHGQNDGRKLLDESSHRAYLDAFGGLSDEVAEYTQMYDMLREKALEMSALTMDEGEKERRIETLKAQILDIESAGLKVGEIDELMARREMLNNASKLTDAVDSAYYALDGGEESVGAAALISEAESSASAATRYYEALGSIADKLRSVAFSVQDVLEELRDVQRELDFSPEEMDALEERLALLRKLSKRYGGDEQAIFDYYDSAMRELGEIESSADSIERAEKEYTRLLSEATKAAAELSKKRRDVAGELETKIRSELSQLNMPSVDFKVTFSTIAKGTGLDRYGCDEVSFQMSANTGESGGKISQIASGGELSRIMLALKNVLSAHDAAGTMVFDEIDTGVSGIAAQRVGEKLSDLSRTRQVLCVTHLPQIAAMADAQFEIRKGEADGRTYTHITELDNEGRKREIARLTGGENITDITLKSAEEQLQAAQAYRDSRKGQ